MVLAIVPQVVSVPRRGVYRQLTCGPPMLKSARLLRTSYLTELRIHSFLTHRQVRNILAVVTAFEIRTRMKHDEPNRTAQMRRSSDMRVS